jgi:hypothetical protein
LLQNVYVRFNLLQEHEPNSSGETNVEAAAFPFLSAVTLPWSTCPGNTRVISGDLLVGTSAGLMQSIPSAMILSKPSCRSYVHNQITYYTTRHAPVIKDQNILLKKLQYRTVRCRFHATRGGRSASRRLKEPSKVNS